MRTPLTVFCQALIDKEKRGCWKRLHVVGGGLKCCGNYTQTGPPRNPLVRASDLTSYFNANSAAALKFSLIPFRLLRTRVIGRSVRLSAEIDARASRQASVRENKVLLSWMSRTEVGFPPQFLWPPDVFFYDSIHRDAFRCDVSIYLVQSYKMLSIHVPRLLLYCLTFIAFIFVMHLLCSLDQNGSGASLSHF